MLDISHRVFTVARIEDVFKLIFNLSNPILVSIFLIALTFVLLYYFYKHLITPVILKYNKEKENLELKHARFMALFAELDPDPVIRIDQTGKIIQTNEAAKKVFQKQELNGKILNEVLPIKQEQIIESISNDTSFTFSNKIGEKYYTILLRGESNLQIAHIYFRDITKRKKYEEMVIESENRLRELTKHSNQLVEEERQRIARELHDGIGQSLSLLRLKMLNLLESNNGHGGPEYVNNLIESLELSIAELKEISYKLKPKVLEEMGLGAALEYLAERTTRETNIKGSIHVNGLTKRLEYNLEIYIYRIVQEALNNIAKHSEATDFDIQVIVESTLIRMMISDNGKGFDPEKTLRSTGKFSGMGLINIQERVKNYSGKFKIDSVIGSGTVLIIEIPLHDKTRWKKKIKSKY